MTTVEPVLVEEIAERLTEAQRDVFTRLLLAITHSDPQRRALIAGYNGHACPPKASERMRRDFLLGQQVRAHLEGTRP